MILRERELSVKKSETVKGRGWMRDGNNEVMCGNVLLDYTEVYIPD